MATRSAVYGLRPPEKTIELDIKESDAIEFARQAYDVYMSIIKGMSEEERMDATFDFLYRTACKITRPHADRLVGILEKKELPLKPESPESLLGGIFLSSIINQSNRREIACRLEKNAVCVGYFLPEDKIFVNYGKSDSWMAREAEGMVINCGVSRYGTAFEARGPMIDYNNPLVSNFINKGSMGVNCTNIVKDRTIYIKNSKWVKNKDKNAITSDLFVFNQKELLRYFSDLKVILDEGKTDSRVLSRLPDGRKLTKDVESIVRKGGLLK